MRILIPLIIICPAVWLLRNIVRALRANKVGHVWWLILALLIVSGCVAGYWLSTRFEYSVKANMRVGGFPLPLAFFVKEGDRWTDFVVPTANAYLYMVANMVFVTGVLLIPLRLIQRVRPK